MTATDRLWLNGFRTVSEMLVNDRLAIEEVREVLEEDGARDQRWLAPSGRSRGRHPGVLRGVTPFLLVSYGNRAGSGSKTQGTAER